jgi:hypothetical protein
MLAETLSRKLLNAEDSEKVEAVCDEYVKLGHIPVSFRSSMANAIVPSYMHGDRNGEIYSAFMYLGRNRESKPLLSILILQRYLELSDVEFSARVFPLCGSHVNTCIRYDAEMLLMMFRDVPELCVYEQDREDVAIPPSYRSTPAPTRIDGEDGLVLGSDTPLVGAYDASDAFMQHAVDRGIIKSDDVRCSGRVEVAHGERKLANIYFYTRAFFRCILDIDMQDSCSPGHWQTGASIMCDGIRVMIPQVKYELHTSEKARLLRQADEARMTDDDGDDDEVDMNTNATFARVFGSSRLSTEYIKRGSPKHIGIKYVAAIDPNNRDLLYIAVFPMALLNEFLSSDGDIDVEAFRKRLYEINTSGIVNGDGVVFLRHTMDTVRSQQGYVLYCIVIVSLFYCCCCRS